MPRHPLRSERAGFTLIELVIVMLILATLTGVVVPRVARYQKDARDVRRMTDLRTVQNAIEQYKLEKGVFPAAEQNPSYGGWDVPHDGSFIPTLVQEGYLIEPISDPVGDSTHHFRYYVYDQGSYECAGHVSFYVLGIRNFEGEKARDKFTGGFACTSRDWATSSRT